VHALNEDFLHTTDAYVDYLRRLTDDGVLAITQWVTVPPRGSLRVIFTAVEAMRRLTTPAIDSAIVVARSWGTTTVLAKPSGFSAEDVERLREWSTTRQLDLDWYPGAVDPVAQYHIPQEPTLVRASRAALIHPDSARRFVESYPFDVSPATDSRPYPHRFLRGESLGQLLRSGATSWLPFAEWGYIALIATLVQSVLLATALIVVPALLSRRVRRAQRDPLLPVLGYFSAIGLGYMAAEIALIQQLTLLLGHPVYAVATTLAAILIFSGSGSMWSERMTPHRARAVAMGLAAALLIFASHQWRRRWACSSHWDFDASLATAPGSRGPGPQTDSLPWSASRSRHSSRSRPGRRCCSLSLLSPTLPLRPLSARSSSPTRVRAANGPAPERVQDQSIVNETSRQRASSHGKTRRDPSGVRSTHRR
jgi:hypothetical protein